MRFMVIVQGTAEAERELKAEDQEALAAMGRFNEEMVKAGVVLAAEGLHATSKGARLNFGAGGKRTVIDGPFTESKELVAGFWLLQTKTREECIEWMKRAPFEPGTTLEIRQVHEAEDFAAADPTGEIRAQEKRLRDKIDSR
jgi:hypothetical protein